MSQKAVVQVQAVSQTAAHEPTVEAVLLRGILAEGMEAVWEGVIIIITSLQALDGEMLPEFDSINQPVTLMVDISNSTKLSQLIGQRLTFSSERSIPVVESIHPWQIEPTT